MKTLGFIILFCIAFVLFKTNNPIGFSIVCTFGITALLLLLSTKFQRK